MAGSDEEYDDDDDDFGAAMDGGDTSALLDRERPPNNTSQTETKIQNPNRAAFEIYAEDEETIGLVCKN